MEYYYPDREWELGGISQKCSDLFISKQNSTYSHCLLEYEINIVRYSSMYYSSVIIPAIGTVHILFYYIYKINDICVYIFNQYQYL